MPEAEAVPEAEAEAEAEDEEPNDGVAATEGPATSAVLARRGERGCSADAVTNPAWPEAAPPKIPRSGDGGARNGCSKASAAVMRWRGSNVSMRRSRSSAAGDAHSSRSWYSSAPPDRTLNSANGFGARLGKRGE